MPCRDYYADEEVRSEAGERLDKYARMLCEAMTILERQKVRLSPELTEWWRKHQDADRKEQQLKLAELTRKRNRRKALAKLNKEERKLLGL